uniref:Uncharacterized protein n=1 Tax=Mastacembelus armatus TaxID=205130 RepID=A0A7N9AK70_9TELE
MDQEQSVLNISPDSEKFFSLLANIQGRRGRMEEQRCSLQPSRSTPATATHNESNVQRLNDQHVLLPTLPGISGTSEGKENGSTVMAGIPVSYI